MQYSAIIVSLFILGAAAQADEVVVVSDHCQTGDPLCSDIGVEQKAAVAPKVPNPTPIAKNPGGPALNIKPRDTMHQTPGKVAPVTPIKAFTPKPSVPTIDATPTANGYEYRFDADGVRGDRTLPQEFIMAHTRTEVRPCVLEYLHAARDGKSLDEIKKAYGAALKCMDQCRTDEDIQFLTDCVTNWPNVDELEKRNMDGFSMPDPDGCTPEKIREGIFSGKYKAMQTGSDGKCFSAVKKNTVKIGPIETDFALLIDNSGSMADASKTIVPQLVNDLVRKSKEMNLDTNLILLTQNLNASPVKINLRDPNLEVKVRNFVTQIYSVHYPWDDVEKPGSALKKHLGAMVRPDADLSVLIVTDEPDSSPEPPGEVLGYLRSLTKRKVVVNSTAPQEKFDRYAMKHFLGDMYSECENGRASPKVDCSQVASAVEQFRNHGFGGGRQAPGIYGRRPVPRRRDKKHSGYLHQYDDDEEEEGSGSIEFAQLEKLARQKIDYARILTSSSGGSLLPLNSWALNANLEKMLALRATQTPIEPDPKPDSLVVTIDGVAQPFEKFAIDPKGPKLVFKDFIDRSKPYEMSYVYLVDPAYFPKKIKVDLKSFGKEIADGKREAGDSGHCITGGDLAALVGLNAFAKLGSLLPWLLNLADSDPVAFFRALNANTAALLSKLIAKEDTDGALFLKGINLALAYRQSGLGCVSSKVNNSALEAWVEAANARVTSSEEHEYKRPFEVLRNYLTSLDFQSGYNCKKR